MNGRIESDLELKGRVEGILANQPPILRHYTNSLSEYTWSTKKGYVERIRVFFRWLKAEKGIEEITPEVLAGLLPMDINAFMTDIQYIKDENGDIIRESSSSRLMSEWSALKSFYEFLVANEFAQQNIVAKTKRPKNKDTSSSKYLSREQMKDLVHTVETTMNIHETRGNLRSRDLTIIKLFLATGMRVETLREINIEDIDFETGTIITVLKGRKIKIYRILDNVMESINDWLYLRAHLMKQPVDEQTGPLFVSLKKRRMSYWAINDTVKTYTEILGIRGGLSCHTMRHSFGTAVYLITKDINYTKEAMGHSSVTTTQRYINEVDDTMNRLVEEKMTMIIS